MPPYRRALAALAAAAAIVLPGAPTLPSPPPPPPAPAGVQETELRIPTSDGLVLPATLRVPTAARPGLPGVVLVHGAGPGPREKYRAEAEALTRAGVATLTYDKRTQGYSLLQRSYTRLAEDTVAAAAELRRRPEVNPAQVGVMGFSEGGWVAPLAASRSPEIAFLVVVGANGVAPLRQQSWADTIKIEHAGVRGSLVDAHARTPYRLITGMGMFPEPYYDPGPPLRSCTLPVLGIWGAQDRLTPPVESVQAYRAALDQAGNRHYTLRTVEGAEHSLRTTSTGFDKGGQFAPGYVDLVSSWIADVADGRPPPTSVAGTGEQTRPTVEVAPLAWYESVGVQLSVVALMLAGFAGFGLTAGWRRLRGRPGPRAAWPARVLAGAGLTAVVGMFGYLGFLQVTAGRTVDPGPLLVGRPVAWLALQLLAVVAVGAGIATGAVVAKRRRAGIGGDRARLGVLLAAGAAFVPWAAYWGLLLP
ncbi:alpha/beta hydrolase family protein [Pseudonocardia xinjiangensis]|uniref:Alpha/beta fold hydrolase n=1 Tax=Pseudonocardia xinjiangensis TaxID=75289 RepID=A0ABX1R9N9_9PSEU|nr:alpha/beta hydrolase [Pseudonocardia xinjiangensis]NMH77100.1 alpha/beta fold hydrolase [Pseudonocardia xinjiangensis]